VCEDCHGHDRADGRRDLECQTDGYAVQEAVDREGLRHLAFRVHMSLFRTRELMLMPFIVCMACRKIRRSRTMYTRKPSATKLVIVECHNGRRRAQALRARGRKKPRR